MKLNNQPELNLYLNIGAMIFELDNIIKIRLNDTLKAYGITYQDWLVLYQLYDNETHYPGIIATQLNIKSSQLTKILDRLEDMKDRRKVQLHLTTRGNEITEKGFKIYLQLPQLMDSISKKQGNLSVEYVENKLIFSMR